MVRQLEYLMSEKSVRDLDGFVHSGEKKVKRRSSCCL